MLELEVEEKDHQIDFHGYEGLIGYGARALRQLHKWSVALEQLSLHTMGEYDQSVSIMEVIEEAQINIVQDNTHLQLWNRKVCSAAVSVSDARRDNLQPKAANQNVGGDGRI